MKSLTNFPICSSSPLAKKLLALQILDFHSAIRYIQHLPYGRNRERANPILVLEEKKGTCSSKHACLKQIAIEEGQTDIDLIIGIYRMNKENTPGIGKTLENTGLTYVPEAHCYLKYKGFAYDFTDPKANFARLSGDILEEQIIQPSEVGTFKVDYHQRFIETWIKQEQVNYDFSQVWAIREACIENLSR